MARSVLAQQSRDLMAERVPALGRGGAKELQGNRCFVLRCHAICLSGAVNAAFGAVLRECPSGSP